MRVPYKENRKLYDDYYLNERQSGGGPMFPRSARFQNMQLGGGLGGVLSRLQRTHIPLQQLASKKPEMIQEGAGLQNDNQPEKKSVVKQKKQKKKLKEIAKAKAVSGKVFGHVIGNAERTNQSKAKKRKHSDSKKTKAVKSNIPDAKAKRVRQDFVGPTIFD